MALVNGGYLHYRHEEILKNLLLWCDFEIISQKCSLGDSFKNCSGKFDLVNVGYLHYKDMKKSLRNRQI